MLKLKEKMEEKRRSKNRRGKLGRRRIEGGVFFPILCV
jgi:hypothetical protein